MADSPSNRKALPHPPAGVPRYFDTSPFDEAGVVAPGRAKSRALEAYEAFAKGRFVEVPAEATRDELERLDRYLLARLDMEREERRMHFGAFALVSVLFFLLFPRLVEEGFQTVWLDLLALLLLALIVPYVFVYFGYENRVRAMALGHLRLLEAIAAKDEAGGAR